MQVKFNAAAKAESFDDIVYPAYGSAKFDGIRMGVLKARAVTRTMKDIPNRFIRSVLSSPMLEKLDGELILGSPTDPDCYRKTSSAVMSHDGEPKVVFYVFGYIDPTMDFLARQRKASEIVKNWNRTKPKIRAVLVKQVLLSSKEEAMAMEEELVNQGHEGMMTSAPGAKYKFGRSTLKEQGLVKVKRFEDAEAKILGMTQLMRNKNAATINEMGSKSRSHKKEGLVGDAMMGALIVEDKKNFPGVTFEIGTGFDEDTRRKIWVKGSKLKGVVKYKFFAGGVKDRPRFPTFLGFRDKRDIV